MDRSVGLVAMIELARPRLTRVLARRHELDLVVLEAPGGSGRSVLLDQALAQPVPGTPTPAST